MEKFNNMDMVQLVEQYQEQLRIIKKQIRDMEKNGVKFEERKKYKQFKQMKNDLQTSLQQMKRYL